MSMGKMNSGDDDDEIVSDINMTPLIDIMFFALVLAYT